MDEDALPYLRAKADHYHRRVVARDGSLAMTTDERWTYREYLYWRGRVLEREAQERLRELGFVQECIDRVDAALGERHG